MNAGIHQKLKELIGKAVSLSLPNKGNGIVGVIYPPHESVNEDYIYYTLERVESDCVVFSEFGERHVFFSIDHIAFVDVAD